MSLLNRFNNKRQQNIESSMEKKLGFQPAYNQSECQSFIKNALDDMENQGYDFAYSSKQPLGKNKKEMKRNGIYLRFNCLSCQQKKRKKRFTSTMGTISIWFQFKKIAQKRKDPWLLIFSFQIYKMKCRSCRKYGEAEIYDSQLQNIQEQFRRIVGEIMDKIPPKRKNRNEQPIQVPDLKGHQHSLCQACKLKKCHEGLCSTIISR